jgi:TPR repeat protein
MGQDFTERTTGTFDAGFHLGGRSTDARKLYKQGVSHLKYNEYSQGGECIIRAAQMGDAAAQDHLGHLYERGFFGKPSFVPAVQWYRKAASQNFPNAQFHLAACYQLGNGVEQNSEEAERWLESAAKMGHPEAAECLRILRRFSACP